MLVEGSGVRGEGMFYDVHWVLLSNWLCQTLVDVYIGQRDKDYIGVNPSTTGFPSPAKSIAILLEKVMQLIWNICLISKGWSNSSFSPLTQNLFHSSQHS